MRSPRILFLKDEHLQAVNAWFLARNIKDSKSMKIRRLRRIAERYLTMTPTLYKLVLDVTGRGSAEKRLYLKLIHRGDVVFDVGANFGYFALLFSDLIGQMGKFMPLSRLHLPLSIYLGALRLMHCTQMCLLSWLPALIRPAPRKSQCLTMILVKHQCVSIGWVHGQALSNLKTYPIQAIKLDDYAAAQSLNVVDFIKCDAEGAELWY